MRLPPHDSDNWDDFDLHAALKKHLEANHMTAEQALMALIEGLVGSYRLQRLEFAGEMPVVLLQGVELLLRQQEDHNAKVAEESDNASADAADFCNGMMCGVLAHQQGAVCDLLCDCMEALSLAPIRTAA